MITKKSLFFIITNIKYIKNIFHKIINFYLIIKLNNSANFDLSRYKIMIIIYKIFI